MDLLMDGLLMAASLFAGCYCWVLSRRVSALKSLDKGLGGAIVKLTRQIELARSTLDEARSAAKESKGELNDLIAKADKAADQLRMVLAAVPDRPGPSRQRPFRPTGARAEGGRDEEPASDDAGAVQAPGSPHGRRGDGLDEVPVPKPTPLPALLHPVRRKQLPIKPASEEDILETLAALADGRP